MVAHKDLTGIDLHEPIGIESATAGQYYAADGSGSGAWTSLGAGLVIPAGIMVDYAGSSAPSLWLLCYGQAISRTTYSALFTALSTTFGSGDGSSTFNLPDCRGRVAVGKDNMGGSTAGRITSAVSGITGTTLGSTGGSQSLTIAQANLPNVSLVSSSLSASSSTSVSINNGTSQLRNTSEDTGGSGSAQNLRKGGSEVTISASATTTTTISGTVPLGGSGTALADCQPSIILNKIIYAGV